MHFLDETLDMKINVIETELKDAVSCLRYDDAGMSLSDVESQHIHGQVEALRWCLEVLRAK